MEKELPKGWKEELIKDVSDISSGIGFPIEHQGMVNGNIPFYKVGDISLTVQAGKSLMTEAKNYVNDDIKTKLKGKLFPEGSIVFAKIGEALKLNRRAILSQPSLVDNNVMVVIPKENCNNLYLFHYLKTQDLSLFSAGNSVPSIRKSSVENIKISLPPLPEQERIVAKLDSLFAHLESARQGLEKIPVLLKQFRQAVLTQAVTGKLTEEWRAGKELEDSNSIFLQILNRRLNNKSKKVQNQTIKLRSDLDLFSIPENWRWSDLGFLIDENEVFRYGVVQPGNDIENEQKLIRVKDLENGKILIDNLRGISFQIDNQYKSARVRTGDLLVSIVGTIGRTAIVTPELEGFNIARALAKIPIKDIEVKFLKYYLDSSNGQNWLDGDTREVARKTLNLEQLKTLTVPIPPLKEQTEIVRRVEALFSKADAIEAQYKKLKAQIDQLPQAILAKAFRGEV